MPKYSETRTYSLDPKALSEAMIATALSAGLQPKFRADDTVVVAERFKLLGFSWLATVTATIKPAGANTAGCYNVSSFGSGPLQTNGCKSALKKLTDGVADKETAR